MTKRKILTIEDLLCFCQTQNFSTFDSKETGYKLAVQIPTSFELDNDENNDHRGMMKLKFRILHEGLNRNGSYVSKKAAQKAANTISDRPIMATIHQLDDGTWDFHSHDMEISEDDEGNATIDYIEKQVGSFSSEKSFWEYDNELDKNYLCAYGYIAEEYTKAADIIRAKGWTKNSCELCIEKMTYNAKEKYLDLEEFYIAASTLLGSDNDGTPIGEGMLGSRADIVDFSVDKNSIFSENTLKIMQGLKETLDNYIAAMSAVNSKKGGHKDMVFDENVEVTGTSEEEVVEQEAAETEVVKGAETTEESTEEVADTEAESEETEDVTPSEDEVKMSVKIGGEVREFSVSLKDKLNALYTLVNETYGETDNDYYDVDVYDDEKIVVMHGWCKGTHYRQSYSVKKDVYSLKGDRTIVRACWLTQDEETKLNEMKSNYSSIQEKLDKYEAEPEKIELLNSEGYNGIKTTEEYSELAKRETYFDMNKDELAEKLDQIVLKYAKAGELQFVAKQDAGDKVGMKKLPIGKPKRSGRYGGLFSKK